MPGLRCEYVPAYIWSKDEGFIIASVKNKKEFMFRMGLTDTLKTFLGEPTDPFESVF